MREKHWLKSYGEIPAEINADRYGSVVELLESPMRNSRRFALLVHTKLRRCRSAFSRVLCLPAFLSLCDGIAPPQLNFKGRNLTAQGRLRNTQRCRCHRKATQLSCAGKRSQ